MIPKSFKKRAILNVQSTCCINKFITNNITTVKLFSEYFRGKNVIVHDAMEMTAFDRPLKTKKTCYIPPLPCLKMIVSKFIYILMHRNALV